MRTLILLVLVAVLHHTASAQNVTQPGCPGVIWHGAKVSVAELSNLEKSYESAREQMAPSDPGLALKMITLSYALFSDRNPTRAEPLFQDGLAQLEKLGAPVDASMAQTLAFMAELAFCRQALDQAEKLYLHAIDINEKLPLSQRQQLVSALANLAGLYYRQGRFEKGETTYARGDTIRVDLGGKPHRKEHFWADPYLVDLVRKGDIPTATARAKAWVQKAETDQQASSAQLAEIDAKLAQANQAKPVLRANNSAAENAALRLIWSLESQVRAAQTNFKNSQLRLSSARNAQAELFHSQKQYEQAESLYLQALTLMLEAGQEKSVPAGRVLSDLGMLYRARGENEKAQSYQTRAHDALLPLLGQEHPDVLESEQELAFLRQQLATDRATKK